MPKNTPRLTGQGYFGSTKAVKESLKKSRASEIRQLKDGDSLTIRFLGEPDTWFGYNEHWLENGPIPCVADDCAGCTSDEQSERKKTPRYLVNVYSADDDKVIALKLPKTAADIAYTFYEKRGTILDRDFEFSRVGAGQNDTKYMLVPDAPSKFTKKVKGKDLEALVMAMLGYEEDEEEEVEDRPTRTRRTRPNKTRDVDPYEDDDEDDDDEDEAPPKRRSSTIKRNSTRTRTVRRNS